MTRINGRQAAKEILGNTFHGHEIPLEETMNRRGRYLTSSIVAVHVRSSQSVVRYVF